MPSSVIADEFPGDGGEGRRSIVVCFLWVTVVAPFLSGRSLRAAKSLAQNRD
jgi:hypothetical protein